MPPDDRLPNPDLLLAGYVRHAAKGVDSSHTPDPPAAADVPVYELQSELKAARARIRALEASLKAAGQVLRPYLGGGGR